MAKALVPFRGQPLVRHAAGLALAGGCGRALVVVGAEASAVRAAAPELRFVDNPGWATGMASSLRVGLAALAATTADAALVLLVDMPGVTPEAVRRVAAHASPDALVMGGYGPRRGHPVLLGRAHWAGVAASATGDHGARDYLRTHAAAVTVVEVGDVADDLDVDTPDALAHHT
ncbi:NTP transferase domain-containing protein [Catenuloplanes sp. NPDC051500]|uniref:nucleotidyltransferase family protein n=1 Tax=Catenuloplanes sp. NPDC051500 TaxID=3363959 RepID=UPI00378D4D76